jgi:hypothetical protein
LKNRVILKKVLGLLMMLTILAATFPFTALAKETKTYYFLNPLGTIEPHYETPLADRSRVTDILYGEGNRTLRLGVAWYIKPLDGEPAIALAQMLKEKWESESADPNHPIPPGLTVQLIMGSGFGSIPASTNQIPIVGHPWNSKTDLVYDTWAARTDAIICGVGD